MTLEVFIQTFLDFILDPLLLLIMPKTSLESSLEGETPFRDSWMMMRTSSWEEALEGDPKRELRSSNRQKSIDKIPLVVSDLEASVVESGSEGLVLMMMMTFSLMGWGVEVSQVEEELQSRPQRLLRMVKRSRKLRRPILILTETRKLKSHKKSSERMAKSEKIPNQFQMETIKSQRLSKSHQVQRQLALKRSKVIDESIIKYSN